MSPAESIIVKVTVNEDFFGDSSIPQAILEKLVPYALGEPDRGIMFIYSRQPNAATSFDVTVIAAASESTRSYVESAFKRLVNLPELSYTLRFTEVIQQADAPQDPSTLFADTEAKLALERRMDGIHERLLREHPTWEERMMSIDRTALIEEFWEELYTLPTPFMGMSAVERARAQMVIDTLLGFTADELEM